MELADVLSQAKEIVRNARDPQQALERVLELLRRVPRYDWVGVYAVEGGQLALRAWRGDRPTQHVRIPLGAGICGAAALSGKVENVPDVSRDRRYIACFPETKSELVVPIFRDGRVVAELDIDSEQLAAFGEGDVELLKQLAEYLSALL